MSTNISNNNSYHHPLQHAGDSPHDERIAPREQCSRAEQRPIADSHFRHRCANDFLRPDTNVSKGCVEAGKELYCRYVYERVGLVHRCRPDKWLCQVSRWSSAVSGASSWVAFLLPCFRGFFSCVVLPSPPLSSRSVGATTRATDPSYVSKGDAKTLGLADTSTDGSFIMRADAENRAAGRGRNSVRISSKAQFADVSLSLRVLGVIC